MRNPAANKICARLFLAGLGTIVVFNFYAIVISLLMITNVIKVREVSTAGILVFSAACLVMLLGGIGWVILDSNEY